LDLITANFVSKHLFPALNQDQHHTTLVLPSDVGIFGQQPNFDNDQLTPGQNYSLHMVQGWDVGSAEKLEHNV
jgi:hypothetical protein